MRSAEQIIDGKEFVFLRVFKAISGTTRFRVFLLILLHKKLNVNEMATLVKKSLGTVSIHLRKLEGAKFVKSRMHKKNVYYQIVKDPDLVLNYDIIKLIETWFKEKKGKEKIKEEKFIKDFIEFIMSQGSLSYFRKKYLKEKK